MGLSAPAPTFSFFFFSCYNWKSVPFLTGEIFTCALDPIASHLPKDFTSLVMPSPSLITHLSPLVLKATRLSSLLALVPSATVTASWNSHTLSTAGSDWDQPKRGTGKRLGSGRRARGPPSLCASDSISSKSCMSPHNSRATLVPGQVTPATELLCPFYGEMVAVFCCW